MRKIRLPRGPPSVTHDGLNVATSVSRPMMPMMETSGKPEVSVIVPARNEEATLGTCLDSLVAQTGIAFEVIVVNDHSTDRTSEIARSFPAVRLIEAEELPAGWTGKNNAVACGARQARGEWLLFTDADTVHLPGSLARALSEAKKHSTEMLSYSPEQTAVTFWERAILPIVFAELARQYPPSKVSDPSSPIAAANGQYILIWRDAYDAVGGHAAISGDILEDVALAKRMKDSGRKMRFRYGADAVRTRMYRNFAQLREGWTKNLALLFPNPGRLAVLVLGLWTASWFMFTLGVCGVLVGYWMAAFLLFPACLLYARIARSNFGVLATLTSMIAGPPAFAFLLLCSRRSHKGGSVSWKGRTYGQNEHTATNDSNQLQGLRKRFS